MAQNQPAQTLPPNIISTFRYLKACVICRSIAATTNANLRKRNDRLSIRLSGRLNVRYSLLDVNTTLTLDQCWSLWETSNSMMDIAANSRLNLLNFLSYLILPFGVIRQSTVLLSRHAEPFLSLFHPLWYVSPNPRASTPGTPKYFRSRNA
jgi:hypothetical protein